MFFNNQGRKIMNDRVLTKEEVLAAIKTGELHPLDRKVFYLKISRKEIEEVLPKPNFCTGGPFISSKGDINDDEIDQIFREFAKL